MTSHELRAALQNRPFKPFVIHMADGRSFEVRHPDFFWIGPNGRTAFVYTPSGTDFSIVDVLLMTEIEFLPQSGQSAAGNGEGQA
ncbi:MAG: hypothetical protein NZM31_15335 [Gemmatales bacterium]|nr:hypothetical protein [Gemmatales bacterium]MDW8388369.1 hypothetical protein [Gemmatales bacterium]